MTFHDKNEDGVKDIEYSNNIEIASSTSSYSRIHMSMFKNNSSFIVLYSDTDSIFTNKPLPPEMVGEGLGLMKLENKFKEIVFLGPKIYSGITDKGQTITKIKGFKGARDIPFS